MECRQFLNDSLASSYEHFLGLSRKSDRRFLLAKGMEKVYHDTTGYLWWFARFLQTIFTTPCRLRSARWWADKVHPEDAMSLEQLSSCLKQHCGFWAAIDFSTWSESAPVLDYIVQRHPHQFETAEFMALFRWDTSKHENFKTRMLGNFYLFILVKSRY